MSVCNCARGVRHFVILSLATHTFLNTVSRVKRDWLAKDINYKLHTIIMHRDFSSFSSFSLEINISLWFCNYMFVNTIASVTPYFWIIDCLWLFRRELALFTAFDGFHSARFVTSRIYRCKTVDVHSFVTTLMYLWWIYWYDFTI